MADKIRADWPLPEWAASVMKKSEARLAASYKVLADTAVMVNDKGDPFGAPKLLRRSEPRTADVSRFRTGERATRHSAGAS